MSGTLREDAVSWQSVKYGERRAFESQRSHTRAAITHHEKMMANMELWHVSHHGNAVTTAACGLPKVGSQTLSDHFQKDFSLEGQWKWFCPSSGLWDCLTSKLSLRFCTAASGCDHIAPDGRNPRMEQKIFALTFGLRQKLRGTSAINGRWGKLDGKDLIWFNNLHLWTLRMTNTHSVNNRKYN